jgi:hypothetical protein
MFLVVVNSLILNPGLISIIENPDQVITLDANFIIPPDRTNIGAPRGYSFSSFKQIWLDPIFISFSALAIHEAVYDEIISPAEKSFIDQCISELPPRLIIHRDSTLTHIEQGLRNSIEEKLYPFTQYDPKLNNKKDRGEVKSLSYIATKGFLYFAANDTIAINLIEDAEKLETGLDNIFSLKMYELIFYLSIMGVVDTKNMRNLYRYQYHLTKNEKTNNPGWGNFISEMRTLYSAYIPQ